MDLHDAIWKSPLNQKQVARKAGCSQQLISDYVHERSGLSKEVAGRIANVLKCDLEQGKTLRDWKFVPRAQKPAKVAS